MKPFSAVCPLVALAILAFAAPAMAQSKAQAEWAGCTDNNAPRQKAIEACTAFLKTRNLPKGAQATAVAWRGVLYARQRMWDAAISDFSAAIAIDPGNAAYYVNRSLAYDRGGRGDWDRTQVDYPRALADADKSIDLAPKDAIGWNNRCWLRAEQGVELDKALADCNESLRLKPGDNATLNSRGLVHYRLGNFEAALKDFDESYRADNNFMVGSRYCRGVTLLRLGKTEEGQADIQAAEARYAPRANTLRDYYAPYGLKP